MSRTCFPAVVSDTQNSRFHDGRREKRVPTCFSRRTSAADRSIRVGTLCSMVPLAGRDEPLRLVQWNNPQELKERIVAEIVRALDLSGADDEIGLEESLGGKRWKELPWAFFWSRFRDNPGAAAKAEAWQILSPIRAGLVGVDALNRIIQARFRTNVRGLAESENWKRKVPKPVGRQKLLYGDKVINTPQPVSTRCLA